MLDRLGCNVEEYTRDLGQNLRFKWVVEKVLIEGQFFNYWMTTSVSVPMKYR